MKISLIFLFGFIVSIFGSNTSSTLEKIIIYGNTRTKDCTILQELCLKEGLKFDWRLINNDRLWLMRLDFLNKSEFLIKSGSDINKKLLLILVQEKKPLSVTPIFESNKLFGLNYGIHATLSNFWGKREKFDMVLQLGGIKKFDFSWKNPCLTQKLRLLTLLQFCHTRFIYLYDDQKPNFKLQTSRINWTLGKRLNRKIKICGKIGLEQNCTDVISVNISGQSTDNLQILEGFIEYDSRSSIIYPQRGCFIKPSIQKHVLPKHNEFYRINLDCRLYMVPYASHILAFQTIIQTSHGKVPVYKRIHMGGGERMRGYHTGYFVGDNCLFSSLEYRFPIQYVNNPTAGIHMGYGGVLFYDMATAWFQNHNITVNQFKSAVGLGVHVIWNEWVFRIEYSPQGEGWGYISTSTSIKF